MAGGTFSVSLTSLWILSGNAEKPLETFSISVASGLMAAVTSLISAANFPRSAWFSLSEISGILPNWVRVDPIFALPTPLSLSRDVTRLSMPEKFTSCTSSAAVPMLTIWFAILEEILIPEMPCSLLSVENSRSRLLASFSPKPEDAFWMPLSWVPMLPSPRLAVALCNFSRVPISLSTAFSALSVEEVTSRVNALMEFSANQFTSCHWIANCSMYFCASRIARSCFSCSIRSASSAVRGYGASG